VFHCSVTLCFVPVAFFVGLARRGRAVADDLVVEGDLASDALDDLDRAVSVTLHGIDGTITKPKVRG
jgi:hypothetical protein